MKYTFVIDISTHGFVREDSRWSQWDTITAEGNTLDELLDDAYAYAFDQDGGSAGEASIWDTEYDNKMADIIIKQYWGVND